MSVADDSPGAGGAAAAPRSPKRPQADLEAPAESASKRSRAASPSDDEAKTRATTAAMANASLTGERDDARGGEMDTGAEGQGAPAAAAAAAAAGEESAAAAAAAASQPSRGDTHDKTTEAGTTTARTAPKSKLCGVCNEKEGKYKCTRCALPFCSVPCNKIHRENHPPDPEPSATANPPTAGDSALEPPPSGAPKPPRDPKNPFSVLDDSHQLRYLFRRYPGLQTRLLEIIAATEPPPEMQSTGSSLNDMMKARAMAAANPKKEQWTHDVGLRNGKEALRKARNAAGEDGEGVREYIELINHLMSEANAAAEADEVIRKQAAEKDAELIRRLMTEDRG
ncbi:HIT zinc finger [Colletotrichum tofieldiae]|uniref:HIT zinc finger n=1 Tax=Colletotrichum tofieldiae TaxID=708197 RepID=A0A166LKZ6_9PEZI|nr:HIT zinc finger [Colletotrichum tofieldiae]